MLFDCHQFTETGPERYQLPNPNFCKDACFVEQRLHLILDSKHYIKVTAPHKINPKDLILAPAMTAFSSS